LFLLFPAFLAFDPWTPLLVLSAALPLLVFWLRPSWKTWSRLVWPIFCLAGGLFVVNLLFTVPTPDAKVIWAWGWFSVTARSWHRAWAVFNRALALSVLSTLTACSFGPLPLVRALMQQAGLSPLWGYSLYAGLNILPSLVQDLRTLQEARRVRMRGRRQTLAEALTLPLTLLAGSVRRAERVSFSMAGRELENSRNRTYVVVSLWKWTDTVYLTVCAAGAAAVLIGALGAGFFRFGLG
jgi:energy-coupling factor transport system permease protein